MFQILKMRSSLMLKELACYRTRNVKNEENNTCGDIHMFLAEFKYFSKGESASDNR